MTGSMSLKMWGGLMIYTSFVIELMILAGPDLNDPFN
jgi:hypothetical protein